MKIGTVSVCYNEERLIVPHLKHIPKWVDERLVLVSTAPWQGAHELPDDTDYVARDLGAAVVCHNWKTEQEQRNAGQEYHSDKDWIVVLDPDEFLTKADWEILKKELQNAESGISAYVTGAQLTYWKSGYRIDPPEDYKQIIAVRPTVRFIDKRVVDCAYSHLPVLLHHLSWARTDKEVWSKITHYAHANEFNTKRWFDEIWKKWTPEMENLHPLTPTALKRAIPAKLPKELQELKLWPPK